MSGSGFTVTVELPVEKVEAAMRGAVEGALVRRDYCDRYIPASEEMRKVCAAAVEKALSGLDLEALAEEVLREGARKWVSDALEAKVRTAVQKLMPAPKLRDAVAAALQGVDLAEVTREVSRERVDAQLALWEKKR